MTNYTFCTHCFIYKKKSIVFTWTCLPHAFLVTNRKPFLHSFKGFKKDALSPPMLSLSLFTGTGCLVGNRCSMGNLDSLELKWAVCISTPQACSRVSKQFGFKSQPPTVGWLQWLECKISKWISLLGLMFLLHPWSLCPTLVFSMSFYFYFLRIGLVYSSNEKTVS